MSSSMCLRCLQRSLIRIDSSLPSNAIHRASFSTSSPISAQVQKKKKTNVSARPVGRQGKTLRLAKNRRVTTGRPPAVGERKALRKRVVLSNTNALEVPGLQDLTIQTIKSEKLKELEGKVVGLQNDTVDALRALEAFKPTQSWSLFRRPATLIRKETLMMADSVESVSKSKHTIRQTLFGDRGSGKSVLQLQALALAQLKNWILVHIPEAQDLVNAHTAYQPISTPDGTLYEQPTYTAKILENFSKANAGILSKLNITQGHDLPVQLPPKTTLARLAEIGARDPDVAWPVWQALWTELLKPSQEGEGLKRPPIMFTCDGVDHIMRKSAYLNPDLQPIHAHELVLVRHFVSLLSGKTSLPNGGMILAAVSESNRAAAPTLDHALSKDERARRQSDIVEASHAMLELKPRVQEARQTVEKLEKSKDSQSLESARDELRQLQKQYMVAKNTKEELEYVRHVKELNPYVPHDKSVQDAMESVEPQKVQGLSKEEARGIMEYYAHSGMLRNTITDGLVSEKWTMAGGGIIGLLEKGSVRASF